MATVEKLLTGRFTAWKPIDPAATPRSVSPVNLRHLKTKLSRLNLTEAAREAVALKAQFRREDEELCRQGRGAEVVADRMKNLGFPVPAKHVCSPSMALESNPDQTYPHDYRLICAGREAPTVVGGQAVNLWAISYLEREAADLRASNHGSKDLDILADKKVIDHLKTVPGWVFKPNNTKNWTDSRQGFLHGTSEDGRKLLVEVLHSVHGLDKSDLARVETLEHRGHQYRVLDPVVMLKAKAAIPRISIYSSPVLAAARRSRSRSKPARATPARVSANSATRSPPTASSARGPREQLRPRRNPTRGQKSFEGRESRRGALPFHRLENDGRRFHDQPRPAIWSAALDHVFAERFAHGRGLGHEDQRAHRSHGPGRQPRRGTARAAWRCVAFPRRRNTASPTFPCRPSRSAPRPNHSPATCFPAA